ncbi:MAG: nucleoside triphosphate pyrophosphohydrolase [Myxococcales bacterium]|jgi:tetrapyrrole methylase family protein/MazG family protein/ATP diphosphatase
MSEPQNGSTLPRLVDIMQRLLGPGGCPWDQEQTLKSLRNYVIEEAHEVVDAIDGGSPEELREELGDLLLQIVFQSELARKEGWFGPDDVIASICDKLIRRHPHVFGDVEVSGASEVVQNWEAIKAREKAGRGVLDGVPRALPALFRAARVGEKAARVGFDWPDGAGARAKMDEELRELDRAVAAGDRAEMEHELGDLLFAVANYARKLDLDAEASLRGTLNRFTDRVRDVEAQVAEQGADLESMSAQELDALWERAKARLAER